MVALTAGAVVVWHTRVGAHGSRYIPGVGDIFGYFLPAYEFQAERMAAGSFPFWNPYQGGGVPFLAMLQPGALYPARLLLLVVPPTTALQCSTFLHLLMALLGTYVLCRRLGASPFGGALAGVVFTTSVGLPWIHATTLLEPAAWLPVLALAEVAILRGGGWGWVCFLGVAGAMPVLAGGYQVALYTVYALALLALGVVLQDGASVARLGRLAAAGALALATAAPQVLPTLAWTQQTARQAGMLTDVQMMPLFTEAGRRHQTLTFFFQQGTPELGYLSIPVIALALFGLVAARPLGLVLGLTALAAALFAIMPLGSVRFSIYRLLPGLGMFRFPTRLLVVTGLFAAVTAALGLRRITQLRPLAPAHRRRFVEGGALVLVVALLVWPYRNTYPVAWTAGPELTAPDARFFPGDTRPPSAYRAFVPAGRLDLRAGVFVRQATRYRVRALQDYEPLSSARLQTFLSAIAGVPTSNDGVLLFSGGLLRDPFLLRPRLLDLVSVRSIMMPEAALPSTVPGWERVSERQDLVTVRNERALPRAYLVDRARFVPDEASALEVLTTSSDFDGHAEVVLVGTPTSDVARVVTQAAAVLARPASFERDDPEHVVVAVQPERPGVLVLADAFAPGWTVTVDGAPRALWQANYFVRGVLVEPGDRQVVFRYRAPGFVPGVAVLALAWSATLLHRAVAHTRRRRRRIT